MLITDEARKEILFALPELPVKEAERIAEINDVSPMTVYRYWKKIKDNIPVEVHPIINDIAELAARRKPEMVKTHKRWEKIQKQL